MKAVVLAGGGGTRLWPLSKETFPKQFINFGSGHSLLQQTVQRLQKAPFIDQVIVATNDLHRSLVKEQLEKINAGCPILVEPTRRNTAPAIGLAVGTDSILIVPSDHLIEPESIFINALEQIDPKEKIVTFGIRPLKPETGYGYIQIGKKYDTLSFCVKHFVEKPNLQTAEKYFRSPQFFWNSGMFLFTVNTFWEELKVHMSEMYTLFQCNLKAVTSSFEKMPNLSIDYALMEKSQNVLVCPLAISWSDVGSWDSVYEVMEKDQNQNVMIGKVLAIDTKNSLIIGGKRMISTIGLEDLIIVETDEAVLIAKKGESQKVKNLVRELQNPKSK